MSQKTTLRLPEETIEEVKRLAQVKTKTEAIVIAMREYIRQRKLEALMNAGGTLLIEDTWKASRHGR